MRRTPTRSPRPDTATHPTEVGLTRLLGYFPRLGTKSKPWSPVSIAAAAGALSGAVVALTRQAITDWPPPIAVTGLLVAVQDPRTRRRLRRRARAAHPVHHKQPP